MELEREAAEPRGPHKTARRALGGRLVGLWALGSVSSGNSSASIFYIFHKNSSQVSRSFGELLFLHKNNTMAILLKTASVRVSSIQIMQIRVQNKGKRVWKSRYVGD